MEIHKIAPFPTLNFLLKEENIELPDVKMSLEELNFDFDRYNLGGVTKYRSVHSQLDTDVKGLADDI
jgi:hypothetical protein